jgi:hypothetical protein
VKFSVIPVLVVLLLAAACSNSSSNGVVDAAGKTKFRQYEVIDKKQGGIAVSRFAVPVDWKATSDVRWNYASFYSPVSVSARIEAPDGNSWIQFYPQEFFVWLDPMHDRAPIGPGSLGGIHHPNIRLPEAMVRYVIGPNRRDVKNLKILGYRPVNDMAKAFPKVFDPKRPLAGEGVCFRVSYELNGSAIDEEFYGFMTKVDAIATPGSRIMEYRRQLVMIHSVGARAGKLESVRPLLGFVATSVEPNPAWQQRYAEVKKAQIAYYDQIQAYNRAEVAAAGAKSRALTEQSNQFLARMDASIAANRTPSQSYSQSSNEEFYKHADDFDQNIRGTEHMKDQYGQVSDQPNDYNYHWTDGFGTYVHSNDPNFDPNRYLNGSYEQMTPTNR